jgi:nitroreductase
MAQTLSPRQAIEPLLRVRQTREFTSDPVSAEELDAIADAGRWSGSSQNKQPWRFITIREPATLRRIAEAGLPSTRALTTAPAAIAVVLSGEPKGGVGQGYDEGRAAERMLIAASLCGLAAGIAWINAEARPVVGEVLGLPDGRFVRTMVAIGHPTAKARAPKSPRGEARLPRSETVHAERWPEGTDR